MGIWVRVVYWFTGTRSEKEESVAQYIDEIKTIDQLLNLSPPKWRLQVSEEYDEPM
jgi:hypothetical protein